MRTTVKMGLASWDQADDDYSFEQLANNWQLLDYHDHAPGRGVPISAGGLGTGSVTSNAIAANTVGSQHLTTALAEELGVGSTGRGALSIPVAQSTSSASYTYLSTPDTVTGIVVTANGLINVDYQALWKVTAGTGFAVLTLNGNGVVAPTVNSVPTNAQTTVTATHLSPLSTVGSGLASLASTVSDSSEVTTGEVVGGGEVRIFVAPGTYTVGLQFACSGGTLTVQNRHLWVRAMNF